MSKARPNIFCFFPLASIGGTETVHANVLRALQEFRPKTFIRYRGNVWKGMAYANSKQGLEEGRAMLPIFSKYSKVSFASDYLEAKRFGRIVKKFFVRRLVKEINSCANPIVIFWHRESIEFLWPYLGKHVKIIDIVHNNSNDQFPDANYLVNDWARRINKRVLVSNGLMKWIEPLYLEANYPQTLKERIVIINQAVSIPEKFSKPESPKLNVAFIGRDSPEKRFDMILEIARQCLINEIDAIFHVVGPDPTKYKDIGSSNMIWYGEVRDREKLNELFTRCHVLLLTSSSEGFPMVVAEAMAFGCIPIVTNVGGLKDHVFNGKNGFLTDPYNCIEESISRISTLINDPFLMQTMQAFNHNYASMLFSFANFERIWKETINQSMNQSINA